MKINKSSKIIKFLLILVVVLNCFSSLYSRKANKAGRSKRTRIDEHFHKKGAVFAFLAKISHAYAYDATKFDLLKEYNLKAEEVTPKEKEERELLDDCSAVTLPALLKDDVKILEIKKASAKIIVGNFHKKDDEDKEFFLVSFRGTETKWNILTDLIAVQTDGKALCAGCKIHKGFLSMFNNIQADKKFKDSLEAAIAAKKIIVVSGHSLGGALANLQAAQILKNHPGVDVHLVTFGAPRVGNSKFSAYLNGSSHLKTNIRFVADTDFVARIPWTSSGLAKDYLHSGTEVRITEVNKNGQANHVATIMNINTDETGNPDIKIKKMLKILTSKGIEKVKTKLMSLLKAAHQNVICKPIKVLTVLLHTLGEKYDEAKLTAAVVKDIVETKMETYLKKLKLLEINSLLA